METIEHIAARALAKGPRCGDVTVVALDGPAGSGKTTLAARLAPRLGAQVLAMDDLYPGWDGLRAAGSPVSEVLGSLRRGEVGRYRRYDWHAGQYREAHEILPQGALIIEGVGSVRAEYLELLSLIVLVREDDPAERLRRGLQRDGITAREQWLAWMGEEQKLHHEVGLEALADVAVDGRGRLVA